MAVDLTAAKAQFLTDRRTVARAVIAAYRSAKALDVAYTALGLSGQFVDPAVGPPVVTGDMTGAFSNETAADVGTFESNLQTLVGWFETAAFAKLNVFQKAARDAVI